MQQNKEIYFRKIAGEIFSLIRKKDIQNKSISKFAREYDIDRGNLSKIERGINCCNLMTAWKIAEASNIKFSEFALMLEQKLGTDFKFYDE